MLSLCVVCDVEPSALGRFEVSRPAMGSTFAITLYASDEEIVNSACDAAFVRVDELNAIFSDYETDSEAMRLSRAAPMNDAVGVSDPMWQVLSYAQQLNRQSNGAFDVTVGPLSRLWRRARRQRRLPSDERLEEALAAVGGDHVQLDATTREVRLTGTGMRLDFGGIAKGYAADQCLRVLNRHGIRQALINAGGDLAIGAAPPGETGWRIAVAPLRPEEPASRILLLDHCGIATSGDAWQFVEIDGQRYSHIIDPRTGLGIRRRSSVTVVAEDCMTADALASAVSVLGAEAGIALVSEVAKAAGLVLTVDGDDLQVGVSKRFDSLPQAPLAAENSANPAGTVP